MANPKHISYSLILSQSQRGLSILTSTELTTPLGTLITTFKPYGINYRLFLYPYYVAHFTFLFASFFIKKDLKKRRTKQNKNKNL